MTNSVSITKRYATQVSHMEHLKFKDWMDDKLPKGIERYHRGPKKDWYCWKGNPEGFRHYKDGAYDAWIYLRNVHGRELAKLRKDKNVKSTK